VHDAALEASDAGEVRSVAFGIAVIAAAQEQELAGEGGGFSARAAFGFDQPQRPFR
jgi:hypothetical protein